MCHQSAKSPLYTTVSSDVRGGVEGKGQDLLSQIRRNRKVKKKILQPHLVNNKSVGGGGKGGSDHHLIPTSPPGLIKHLRSEQDQQNPPGVKAPPSWSVSPLSVSGAEGRVKDHRPTSFPLTEPKNRSTNSQRRMTRHVPAWRCWSRWPANHRRWTRCHMDASITLFA